MYVCTDVYICLYIYDVSHTLQHLTTAPCLSRQVRAQTQISGNTHAGICRTGRAHNLPTKIVGKTSLLDWPLLPFLPVGPGTRERAGARRQIRASMTCNYRARHEATLHFSFCKLIASMSFHRNHINSA